MNKKEMEKIIKSCKEKDAEIINKLIKDTLQRIFPKIKGKVDAKKLKWLGVSLGMAKNASEYWVMRRGVQISPTLKITRKLDKEKGKFFTKYEYYKKTELPKGMKYETV